MNHAPSMITIHRPLDAICQVISGFGAAGQYLDGVAHCTVEGEGIGALAANFLAEAVATSSTTVAPPA